MIISSLGSNGDSAKRLLDLLFPNSNDIKVKIPGRKQETIKKERLRKEIIVGDVAGILLPFEKGKNANYNLSLIHI